MVKCQNQIYEHQYRDFYKSAKEEADKMMVPLHKLLAVPYEATLSEDAYVNFMNSNFNVIVDNNLY